MTLSVLIPWLLLMPLAIGALSLLLPAVGARCLAWVGFGVQLGVAVALWRAVSAVGPTHYAIGGWPAPLGIGLYVDSLAGVMLVTSAVVTLAVSLYAGVYLKHLPQGRYFWALLWFLLAALNAIWLAADLFNLYVGLELLSLAAVGLVAISGKPAALAAALRYLLMALLGSLLYLLGVVLVYSATGSLALPDLIALAPLATTATLTLALMITGLAFKTALWPLHGWLPPAHGGALTPVSAVLSALVVKAPLYILVRLWLNLGPEVLTVAGAQLLGALGAGAVLWGSLLALRQVKLKMVVAYSTVAQLGYLFLLFPLAVGTSTEAAVLAWNGTVLQIISHALAKAALFLAVGNLILAAGKDGVKDLIGIGRHNPWALVTVGLAGMSLMGLPPSGGFLAKWLLLKSALTSGQWWWVLVLVIGGLLTAAYLFRVLRQPFWVASEAREFTPVAPWLELAPFVLATAAILLGLTAAGPLALLQAELPVQTGPLAEAAP